MTRIFSSSLLLAVISLLGVGLVQVYSSSYVHAIESYGDGLFFFKRQFVFALLSVAVLLGTAAVPFRYFEKWAWAFWPVTIFLLLMTFVPGLGVRAGGAARWIQLPFGVRFEPAELAKIAFALWVASMFSRPVNFLAKIPWPWLALVTAAPMLILLKQPDFGTFAILTMVGFGVLFCFGLRWRYIVGAMAVVLPLFYFLVMTVPYRRARVLAFLDPWADPEVKGFQVIQSMLSLHAGGLTGAGLGQGQGKLFFLPEAHTDFTLAVFGEEAGFVGVFLLLMLFGFVVLKGLQLAVRAEDRFGRAAALGLSMVFGLSVFVNAGVVMGLLPTKGLTLPFMSYGGSSLLCVSFLFGILLSLENSLDDPWRRKFARINRRKGGKS